MSKFETDKRFVKRGTTRELTTNHYTWFKGLLQYIRDVEVVIPDRSRPDDLEAMLPFPMFAGFTFRLRPGRLCLIFNSYPSTEHGKQTHRDRLEVIRGQKPDQPNTILHLINTASKEPSLRMIATTAEETDPAKKAAALELLQKIRLFKAPNDPPLDIQPQDDEDWPRTIYVAEVHKGITQGEQWGSKGNNRVDEGRPVVDISQLEGFEDWPMYHKPGQEPDGYGPITLSALGQFLDTRGIAH